MYDECACPCAASASSSVDCPKRDRCGEATALSRSAFRQVEKKYKLLQLNPREAKRAKTPATDFTDVVDFQQLGNNTEANRAHIHKVALADPEIACYTFAAVPGLLVFPSALTRDEQTVWCRDAILRYADARRHPNILSTHAKEPRQTQCYQPPMRWATLGFSYQWTSKTYDPALHSSFPTALKAKMEALIGYVARVKQDQWQCASARRYQPQTAIVNYYPVGSMMMCHQDISEEVLEQPLVSLSLGCSAIFLMGTTSRDDAPFAFLLRSGDVAAFTGPSRTAFHSTPRILDDCPSYLTVSDADLTEEERSRYANHAYYHHRSPDGALVPVEKDALSAAAQERYWRLCMRHMRVNVNARQVYERDCAFLFEEDP